METLQEYTYTGISGLEYHPRVENGTWYLVSHIPMEFLDIVYHCQIPDEDAAILKLKYGG